MQNLRIKRQVLMLFRHGCRTLTRLTMPTVWVSMVSIVASSAEPPVRVASMATKVHVVPVAGNGYAMPPGRLDLDGAGRLRIRSDGPRHRIAFAVDRSTSVRISGDLRGSGGYLVMTHGDQRATVQPERTDDQWMQINVDRPKYVTLDLVVQSNGDTPATLSLKNLNVQTTDPDTNVRCVSDNDANRFYWGRRGASVHLRYLPEHGSKTASDDYVAGYVEVTVPEGLDPIGSFFMAAGFGEGYFGIQVNGPNERRVLFSVWSPFKTDDPTTIPESDRVECLSSGEGVVVGKFGGEGSGGQNRLRYDWRTDQTYRFLIEAKSTEPQSCRYTAWFAPIDEPFRLIASVRRPQTEGGLRRFHSFLENFDPTRGHLRRGARYGNVWMMTGTGRWNEVTAAQFTFDATAARGDRGDATGGSQGDHFYLRNGGFAEPEVAPVQVVERTGGGTRPSIDWSSLPRSSNPSR